MACACEKRGEVILLETLKPALLFSIALSALTVQCTHLRQPSPASLPLETVTYGTTPQAGPALPQTSLSLSITPEHTWMMLGLVTLPHPSGRPLGMKTSIINHHCGSNVWTM